MGSINQKNARSYKIELDAGEEKTLECYQYDVAHITVSGIAGGTAIEVYDNSEIGGTFTQILDDSDANPFATDGREFAEHIGAELKVKAVGGTGTGIVIEITLKK